MIGSSQTHKASSLSIPSSAKLLAACCNDIERCDYVSLDMEFSGLFLASKKCPTLDEYYSHCKDSVNQFLCMQIGICCATYDRETHVWLLRPYNFNVYPLTKRTCFNVDSTCLAWLYRQGFDLNKWILDGCDYSRLSAVKCPHVRTDPNISRYGLQTLIEHIIEHEKPLIVHNGFLDMLHVYDKFIDALPDSLNEWKNEVQRLFAGGVYDTKRIAYEAKLRPSAVSSRERRHKAHGDGGLSSYTKVFESPPEDRAEAEAAGDGSADVPNSAEGGVVSQSSSQPRTPVLTPHATINLDTIRTQLLSTSQGSFKFQVEPNESSESYKLISRCLTAEEEPTPTRPVKKARNLGHQTPAGESKDHEAGYDAMMTMHLFLLEIEASSQDLSALVEDVPRKLLSIPVIRNSKDKIEVYGIAPGYVDLVPSRSKIREKMSASNETRAITGEEILNAPLFKLSL